MCSNEKIVGRATAFVDMRTARIKRGCLDLDPLFVMSFRVALFEQDFVWSPAAGPPVPKEDVLILKRYLS